MSACGRCGAVLACAMADGGQPGQLDQPCWCCAQPLVMPVPTDAASTCYCPDCLRLFASTQANPG